jgi:hypothetical protein
MSLPKEITVFKNSCLALIAILLMTPWAYGADLYKVAVHSQSDAEKLKDRGVEALVQVGDGYLILTDIHTASQLAAGGLALEHLAANITKEELALDNSHGGKLGGQFPVLYQQGQLRLLKAPGGKALSDGSSLTPINNDNLVIQYQEPLRFSPGMVASTMDLQGLIDQENADTVYNQLNYLQAFNGRLAGSASNRAARDWLVAKLISYGYSNAHTESFTSYVNGSYVTCYNVVASKTGTRFPKRQVLLGAHFDAVSGSPGADDNGSGTIGVLECARVMATVPTQMTYVFAFFDSEEQGLYGSAYYANAAASRGDSIVCMLNMDMIANAGNWSVANLYYGGTRDGYARLWSYLADSLVGISGLLVGNASNSDHHSFAQAGFDVIFSEERIFSGVYHTYRDSTTYIGWDYYNRMIKGNIATGYTISESPLPVRMISLRDGGDGQSLQADWHRDRSSNISFYRVYYDTDPATGLDSMTVTATDTSALISGLTEGQSYAVYVLAFDTDGHSSVVHPTLTGIPHIKPVLPAALSALPRYLSVRLVWKKNNNELDFNNYTIIRDGVIIDQCTDTVYADDDFSLGTAYHSYLVVARDNGGNISDTTGAVRARARAATLEPGRVLAVNRSLSMPPYIVNEVVTGQFMREALNGYSYDYLSDTAYVNGTDTASLNLDDMLNYEVVMIGAEAGRGDDLGTDPAYGGKLDSICYYLSIGGKVIVFGRWGDVNNSGHVSDTFFYTAGNPDYGYKSYFHLNSRVKVFTTYTPTTLSSDLIGAKSTVAGYPDLSWDSLAAVNHSAPWAQVTGIPSPSFGLMTGGTPQIIYTYDSRNNSPYTEGRTVGWRYLGSDYKYVMFNVPLSFMNRTQAVAAMRKALGDLLSAGSIAATAIDPDTLDIPHYTDPNISVYLGNFGGGKTAADVNNGTVLVNDAVSPAATSVIPAFGPFTGEVLKIDVPVAAFVQSYGALPVDTSEKIYRVTWKFTAETQNNHVDGQTTLIGYGYLRGDANGDRTVNVGDAVSLINYIFKNGAAPTQFIQGDANCDGRLNVGDVVYLINYIFKGGPPPTPGSICSK